MLVKCFFAPNTPIFRKGCGEEEEEEGDQGVSWTTSVCSVRAVLFKVSCKSISRKLLSLIKIKNCLVLSNNRSSH